MTRTEARSGRRPCRPVLDVAATADTGVGRYLRALPDSLSRRVFCRPAGAWFFGRSRSRGLRPRCSTQVESACPKILESGMAVPDREQRGAFPGLVSPVRGLPGGVVYKSEGLRPWLRTLAPSEPESATPVQSATCATFRPKGTTVGSQGRKPLDSDTLEQQSPGGAKEDGKRRMGAAYQDCRVGIAHQSVRPAHLWWAMPTLLLTALLTTAAFAQRDDDAHAAVRFEYIDVYIDSGSAPLAAYQFELTDSAESIKIVGIEGGEHEAFATPPYYDPKALKNNRVIIAAFSTAADLPTGKTRVATVHVQIEVDVIPEITINLTIAGDVQGNELDAEVSFTYSDEE